MLRIGKQAISYCLFDIHILCVNETDSSSHTEKYIYIAHIDYIAHNAQELNNMTQRVFSPISKEGNEFGSKHTLMGLVGSCHIYLADRVEKRRYAEIKRYIAKMKKGYTKFCDDTMKKGQDPTGYYYYKPLADKLAKEIGNDCIVVRFVTK
ncbi:hypothetical protein B6U67_03405 [Methanosarcinales archaeon ex4484_138]|nr:MAG: hypothetical protein B6U67_03405 [Methanosarcinales archaeon ex4484_138]